MIFHVWQRCLRPATVLMVLLASFAGSAATNSPWVVRVWQSGEGLPNNSVGGITQTRDGYLWVATRAALARFDGVRFEEFFTTNFIGTANVGTETLLLGSNGDLYVALDTRQLVRLGPGKAQIFGHATPGRQRLTPSLVEDGAGRIWINYRNGELCYLEDNQIVTATRPDGRPMDNIDSIARAADGRLWYASDRTIGIWGEAKPVVTLPNRTIRTQVTSAAGGGVWIAAGSQLYRCDKNGVLRECGSLESMEELHGTVDVMLEDRQGALWIGTSRHGLLRFDGRRIEPIPVADRRVFALYEDREDNLWVGTSGGVNLVRPRAIRLEAVDTGSPFEAVQGLVEDAPGRLWAVSRNNVVVCRTNDEWTVASSMRAPDRRASSLAVDSEGGLWVGTLDRVLLRYHGGTVSQWRAGLAMRSIRALLVSSRGDLWIAGNSPSIVQRLRGGKLDSFPVPSTLRLQVLVEDTAGDIWLGGEKGMLLRMTGETLIDETPRTLPLEKNIRALHATSDGSVWIGYAGGGVGRFRNGRFARIMPEHGLPDHTISQIVADGLGWLWFGADCGLFKVRQQEMDDVAEGRAARVRSVSYRESEGLPLTPALFGVWPGAQRTRDGRLWIPMRAGLAVIDPMRLRESSPAPPVVLKRVTVDEETAAFYRGHLPARNLIDLKDGSKALELVPGHRRLQFEFTALSLHDAQNVRFRYRLAGFDHDWIEAGAERSVRYSRLGAGKYRFHVTASNGDGVWNETGASLAIVVPPFIWQTWWFRLAVLTAFTTALIAIVRYVSFQRLRTRLNTLQQQAALDRERARIARDIHDDLGSRLTQITLMGGVALKNAPPEQLSKVVQEMSAMARKGIQSLDETVWAVNPRNDTLSHLIDYLGHFTVEFLRSAGIRYQIALPDHPPERVVSSEVRHNLFLVVKEALNNVVRHAAATEATLDVVVTGQLLTLTIADNGCGFEFVTGRAGADGLHNMRLRMEEIGGSFELESEAGKGTRVKASYPLRSED